MITATFTAAAVEASAADSEGRTIRGVAVPWNTVGTVSDGTRVRFTPGALEASARPIVTIGHDGSPIGRTVDNAATDTGMMTTVRVSKVRGGDEALILAADGVFMFSVGVNPTEFHYDDDGVLIVDAGDWHHTALLPFGAFADALVTDVAASEPIHPPEESMTDTIDTAPPPAPVAVEAAAPPPVNVPAVVPVHGPTSERPALTLAGVAQIISSGVRDRIGASGIRAQIEAALTNVTTADVPGFVRPAYRAEILALVDHGMPVVNALQQRPLPASGMTIEYPRWTAPPAAYAVQAAEKTAIASAAVTSSVASVDIDTWAQGNDISFQALNRSDPSFIDAYLRAAAVDAARKYDTAVITALLAAATAGTAGASFVANVKALFTALNPATTPAGPMFLAVSYDVMLDLIDVTGLNGPAFWDASIDLGSFLPSESAGGMTMFTDWNMPAGTMLLGSRNAAASYGGPETSADVRVVDVSLLGVDVGVYFYAALAIEYPGAFAKLSGIVMAAGTGTAAKAK